MSPMRLEGKVAVVAGATGRLGGGSARRLASEGARVVAVDIDGDGAARVAEEIGGLAVAADVSRGEDVLGLARCAAVYGGPLGLRVNVIAPGIVPTELFAGAGRWDPAELDR